MIVSCSVTKFLKSIFKSFHGFLDTLSNSMTK
nr:MAG TPA: hypothetical protein [Herelleviridae sp.]